MTGGRKPQARNPSVAGGMKKETYTRRGKILSVVNFDSAAQRAKRPEVKTACRSMKWR